ncbi:MAG: tyrosine-type recombinase/integrase [Bacteroidetes bacterium]|nr:tyrosine-type recombinase/integrase [Bacteroidota bacterium]
MRITKQTKYLSSEDFFHFYAKLIKDTTKGVRIKSDGSRIRLSTIDNYVRTQKVFADFLADTGFDFKLYIITNLTPKEKEQAKKYYKKFFKEFTDYMYMQKDFYDNYVGFIIKGLRIFFNYLNTELNIQVGDYHKKFHTPNEEVPIVVLIPEQLNYLIYDKELNSVLPEHLIKVRDIFVFGCTVALRFSDLMKLTQDNLQFYNNTYYLKVNSIKTNTNTTIKLPEYAIDILKKYHKKQKTLLPLHSNAWLNKCLKELAKYIKLNEPQIKYRTKRGVQCVVYKNKAKKEHYTLSDHITTHTMRRTAITTMLRLGMPDQVVRKISGHAANSKEFYRYVEFAQNYIDEHTDMVFDKISNLEASKSAFS